MPLILLGRVAILRYLGWVDSLRLEINCSLFNYIKVILNDIIKVDQWDSSDKIFEIMPAKESSEKPIVINSVS